MEFLPFRSSFKKFFGKLRSITESGGRVQSSETESNMFIVSRSKKVFFALFAVMLILSACVLPEKNDPFERLPEEKTEIIAGEIFPFSVSVSTRATHRLEKDDRLVSYIASDIVLLDDFVGRKVELEGIRRKEKMREIFWVEKIKLTDLEEEIGNIVMDNWFSTKNFSFIFPENWEYSTAPDGTAHFLDRSDPARRVFFQFSAEDIEKVDKKIDPNILISNLAGTKKVTTDSLSRERQEIILFSNLFDRKYSFVFTANFEEFEKKKSFFKLLNSFVEGEENVSATIEAYKKELAEKEAEKIEKEAIIEEVVPDKEEEDSEEVSEEEESFFDKILGRDDEKEVEDEEESVEGESKSENEDTGKIVDLPDGFKNLITEKAFAYDSSYYKF
ncbi:MAG: hypothetical protein OEL89_01480, partial [Candidatus Peregrinibacteria bacterium]|nr:hypothetical protein [Candidatus Peregrinibacteria bacterium]